MFPLKRNSLYKILFLCILCIQCLSLQCMAANEEITVQSKQFVSERHSSLFHRTFCRSLLSAPKKISYVECDRLHLTPCQICISSALNDRLKSDLHKRRYEQQQQIRAENAKKKRAAVLKRQQQRRESLQLEKEQEARQQVIERRQQAKDRVARDGAEVEKEQQRAQQLLELRHQQYRVDVEKIKQRLKEIEVAFTVQNVSGFSLPKHFFSIQTHIVGNLDFPLDKQSIRYGYTIQCNDSCYAYSIHDNSAPLTFLSTSNIVRPTITVTTKYFLETEQTVLLEDENFKIALHKISYAAPLSVDISIRNKSKTVQKIEKMSVTLNDITYYFVLDSVLILPPKSSLSHLMVDIFSPDPTITLSPQIQRLSQPLIYSDLFKLRNNVHLALSVYCKQQSIDQNTPEFHQQIEVPLRDLFYQ